VRTKFICRLKFSYFLTKDLCQQRSPRHMGLPENDLSCLQQKISRKKMGSEPYLKNWYEKSCRFYGTTTDVKRYRACLIVTNALSRVTKLFGQRKQFIQADRRSSMAITLKETN
jgi:hypothetical protein